MSKAIKIIASIIGIIIILLIIGIILLVTLVNPNQFKKPISAYALKHTGRTVAINGDISWSFFPWIGLKVHDVSVDNQPGFEPKIFAKLNTADVSVKFMPLLSGKIEADKIIFQGLQLNLITNQDGSNNWSAPNQKKPAAETNAAEIHQKKSSNKNFEISISDFEIINANIHWMNKQKNQKIDLDNFYLNSKNIAADKFFPIQAKFRVTTPITKLDAQFMLSSEIQFSKDFQQFSANNLEISSDITENHSGLTIPLHIRTNANIDLKNQTLQLNNLAIESHALKLNATISGKDLNTTPLLSGKFSIAPVNLKAYLASNGIKITTPSQTALQQFQMHATFDASPKFLKLTDVSADLDNSQLNGHFDLSDFGNKVADFDLKLNQINLDHYLPLDVKADQLNKAMSQQEITMANPTTTDSKYALLRQLQLTGNFNIGHLTMSHLNLSNINGHINSANGIVRITPMTMQLYDGSSNTSVYANFTGNTPSFDFRETLEKIQLKPLLTDLSNFQKLSGTASLNTNLNFSGTNKNEMLNSLHGNVKYQIASGELAGIDFMYELQKAVYLAKKLTPQTSQSTDNTNFGSLTGSANIAHGIATTNDTTLQSKQISLDARGSVNLVNSKIDMHVDAKSHIPFTISSGGFNVEGDTLTIPFMVTGTLQSPHVIPDIASLAGQLLQNVVKGKLQQTIQENIPKNIGEKAGATIKNFLNTNKLF